SNELQRLIGNDIRAVAMKLLRHAVAAEDHIEIEEIVGGDAIVEAQLAGRERVAGEDCSARRRLGVAIAVLSVQMPLAKMTRRGGRLRKHLPYGHTLGR